MGCLPSPCPVLLLLLLLLLPLLPRESSRCTDLPITHGPSKVAMSASFCSTHLAPLQADVAEGQLVLLVQVRLERLQRGKRLVRRVCAGRVGVGAGG